MTDLVSQCREWVAKPTYKEMTARQMAVIGILADVPGVHRNRDIARQINSTKPVVTRAIIKLEQMGLARCLIDQADKRDRIYELTDQGRSFRQSFVDMGQ